MCMCGGVNKIFSFLQQENMIFLFLKGNETFPLIQRVPGPALTLFKYVSPLRVLKSRSLSLWAVKVIDVEWGVPLPPIDLWSQLYFIWGNGSALWWQLQFSALICWGLCSHEHCSWPIYLVWPLHRLTHRKINTCSCTILLSLVIAWCNIKTCKCINSQFLSQHRQNDCSDI